jgi:molecular chaperone GrpE
MGCRPTGAIDRPVGVGQHPIASGRGRPHAGAMLQVDKSSGETGGSVASLETETLRQELVAQRDSYLRLAADFENFKRRSRLEFESRAAAQKEAFIAELLPVLDSFERALASGASSDSAQFHQGVEITLKQLQQLLRQHGIESGAMVGSPFDPHCHDALSRGHDPTQPDHTILNVLRRGYWRGDKVIRPANVVVNDLTSSTKAPDAR